MRCKHCGQWIYLVWAPLVSLIMHTERGCHREVES